MTLLARFYVLLMRSALRTFARRLIGAAACTFGTHNNYSLFILIAAVRRGRAVTENRYLSEQY
jgi:hypothetical protein